MTTILDKGDSYKTSITYKDENDAEIDPVTVELTHIKPDGTSVLYTYNVDSIPVRDSIGVYSAVVTIDQYGLNRLRWSSAINPRSVVIEEIFARNY